MQARRTGKDSIVPGMAEKAQRVRARSGAS